MSVVAEATSLVKDPSLKVQQVQNWGSKLE